MVGNTCATRSLRCEDGFLIYFANLSVHDVDVIWIDYEGYEVVYKTLRPRQMFKLQTFVSHPWIFRHRLTKRRFLFQTKPQTTCQDIVNSLTFIAQEVPHNEVQVIYIFDVFQSLKEKCFQSVYKSIGLNGSEELNESDIPRALIKEYHKYVNLFLTVYDSRECRAHIPWDHRWPTDHCFYSLVIQCTEIRVLLIYLILSIILIM